MQKIGITAAILVCYLPDFLTSDNVQKPLLQCIDSDESLHGKDILFDLTTDCHETHNLFSDYNYKSELRKIESNIEYWKTKVGDGSSPDTTSKNSVWHSKGGVVPWVTDDTIAQSVIPQAYNHKGAPHIVLFLVDDWGWNDAGYQSTYMSGTTPNIDKLAANGIKLTNYYTHELCAPSRAALMTGRYALRFGMHGSTLDDQELYLEEVTMAEELKSAGYRTNLVGKWHLGMSTLSRTPTYRGFDYFYGYLGGFIDYWTKKYGSHLDFSENTDLITDAASLSSSVHSEDLYVAAATAVINDHAKNYPTQPMFLYFASQLIHTPWAAPTKYMDRCSDEGATDDQMTYCAMNLMLDEVVGKLTCALDAAGMNDNTLFVLAGDNGGNHLMDGNTYPFRGSKGSFYRGGESVPAFISGSGNLIPKSRMGTRYEGQMHVTDWLPTFMRLASNGKWTGSMKGHELDGVDMWNSVIQDTSSHHKEIVHYLDSYGNVSYQNDMLKLVHWDSEDLGVMLPIAPTHVFTSNFEGDTALCEFNADSTVGMRSTVYTMEVNTDASLSSTSTKKGFTATTQQAVMTVSKAAGDNIFVTVFCVCAFLLVMYQLATFKSSYYSEESDGEAGDKEGFHYITEPEVVAAAEAAARRGLHRAESSQLLSHQGGYDSA